MSAQVFGERWWAGPARQRQLYAQAVSDLVRPIASTIYLLAELPLARGTIGYDADDVVLGQDVAYVEGPEPFAHQHKHGARTIVIPKHCLLVVRNIRIGLAEQVKAHLIADPHFALCVDDTGEMPTTMVARALRLERQAFEKRMRKRQRARLR